MTGGQTKKTKALHLPSCFELFWNYDGAPKTTLKSLTVKLFNVELRSSQVVLLTQHFGRVIRIWWIKQKDHMTPSKKQHTQSLLLLRCFSWRHSALSTHGRKSTGPESCQQSVERRSVGINLSTIRRVSRLPPPACQTHR